MRSPPSLVTRKSPRLPPSRKRAARSIARPRRLPRTKQQKLRRTRRSPKPTRARKAKMKVKVQTLSDPAAKGAGDIELNDEIFAVEPRADILHRVVTWQLEKRRGTARAARERSEV